MVLAAPPTKRLLVKLLPLGALEPFPGRSCDKWLRPGRGKLPHNPVHGLRDLVGGMARQEFMKCFGVELAAGLADPLRMELCSAKQVVWQ